MQFLTENGMYAVVADVGMSILSENGYCHKLYRKTNDFSDCVEVNISEVPTENEEISDEEALSIIMGGVL